jgi:predicted small lipoprotein YifL
MSQKIRIFGLIALTGLALAGCGRRGDMEPPAGSTPPAPEDVSKQTGSSSPVDGTAIRRIKVVPPRDPFILDKIL